MLFFVVALVSFNVFATMPGDESISSTNTHCDYEKYKNRSPDSCPRVERVLYSYTLYDNDEFQSEMMEKLRKTIEAYKNKSKHSSVELVPQISKKLKIQNSFESVYLALVPDRNVLRIEFVTRIFEIEKKYISHTTIYFISSKTVSAISDVSDPLSYVDLENHLFLVLDKYVKNIFVPQIFPDATW